MPLPQGLKTSKAFQLPKRSSSSHDIPIPSININKSLKRFSSFTTKSLHSSPNGSPTNTSFFESSAQLEETRLYHDIGQVRIALDHFLNSEIHEAEAILKPHQTTSMYYSLGYSFILYLKCVMTFQKPDIDQALESAKQTIQLAGNLRKREASGWIDSITSWVKGTTVDDIKNMSIVQRHAELVYAESYLLKALLSILYDESVMSFLRESLNIRSSYNTYMTLEKYLDSIKTTNDNNNNNKQQQEIVDDSFTSGVALGVGCFSLILSMLPASVVKVAEFIGFTSDREHGLHVLESVGGWNDKNNDNHHENHGLRRDLCDMILITYHIVLSKIIPLSHVDEGFACRILDDNLKRFPKGVFFLYLNGRSKVSQRLLKEAKEQYHLAIETQKDWKQLQHMCYWELGLIALIESEWKESYRIYDLLSRESNWSKAVYCYLKSVSLYMMAQLEDEDKEKVSLMNESVESMSLVTSEKKKIAGKSIPMEKFMSRKSRKFLNQDNHLLLADLEALNALTAFDFMPVSILQQNLKRIQLELDRLGDRQPQQQGEYYFDDLCLANYLRAITSRMLFDQGIEKEKMQKIHQESTDNVFEHADKIQLDHYIYYFTCYEHARMLLLLAASTGTTNGQREEYMKEAESKIQIVLKANEKHQYGVGAGVHAKNKYSLASALVFKCHNCMANIKEDMATLTQQKK